MQIIIIFLNIIASAILYTIGSYTYKRLCSWFQNSSRTLKLREFSFKLPQWRPWMLEVTFKYQARITIATIVAIAFTNIGVNNPTLLAGFFDVLPPDDIDRTMEKSMATFSFEGGFNHERLNDGEPELRYTYHDYLNDKGLSYRSSLQEHLKAMAAKRAIWDNRHQITTTTNLRDFPKPLDTVGIPVTEAGKDIPEVPKEVTKRSTPMTQLSKPITEIAQSIGDVPPIELSMAVTEVSKDMAEIPKIVNKISMPIIQPITEVAKPIIEVTKPIAEVSMPILNLSEVIAEAPQPMAEVAKPVEAFKPITGVPTAIIEVAPKPQSEVATKDSVNISSESETVVKGKMKASSAEGVTNQDVPVPTTKGLVRYNEFFEILPRYQKAELFGNPKNLKLNAHGLDFVRELHKKILDTKPVTLTNIHGTMYDKGLWNIKVKEGYNKALYNVINPSMEVKTNKVNAIGKDVLRAASTDLAGAYVATNCAAYLQIAAHLQYDVLMVSGEVPQDVTEISAYRSLIQNLHNNFARYEDSNITLETFKPVRIEQIPVAKAIPGLVKYKHFFQLLPRYTNPELFLDPEDFPLNPGTADFMKMLFVQIGQANRATLENMHHRLYETGLASPHLKDMYNKALYNVINPSIEVKKNIINRLGEKVLVAAINDSLSVYEQTNCTAYLQIAAYLRFDLLTNSQPLPADITEKSAYRLLIQQFHESIATREISKPVIGVSKAVTETPKPVTQATKDSVNISSKDKIIVKPKMDNSMPGSKVPEAIIDPGKDRVDISSKGKSVIKPKTEPSKPVGEASKPHTQGGKDLVNSSSKGKVIVKPKMEPSSAERVTKHDVPQGLVPYKQFFKTLPCYQKAELIMHPKNFHFGPGAPSLVKDFHKQLVKLDTENLQNIHDTIYDKGTWCVEQKQRYNNALYKVIDPSMEVKTDTLNGINPKTIMSAISYLADAYQHTNCAAYLQLSVHLQYDLTMHTQPFDAKITELIAYQLLIQNMHKNFAP
jgi:hypothetical protein